VPNLRSTPFLLAILGLIAAVAPFALRAEEAPLARYATVAVETARTSIYIGSVTLAMPAFTRQGITYSTTYAARVFPYFFYNEKGSLSIDVTDADLRRLERGETIEFTGRAKTTDGEDRHIEGRAQPTDASSGKLKVRVFVSKKIQLIFNTTYRFVPEPR
jgi:hypothetical protein